MKYTFTKKMIKGCCCRVGSAFYKVEQAKDKDGYNLQIFTIEYFIEKFHFYKLFELEEKMLSIQPDKRRWKITIEATKKEWEDYAYKSFLKKEV